jgi:hypothetical protein
MKALFSALALLSFVAATTVPFVAAQAQTQANMPAPAKKAPAKKKIVKKKVVKKKATKKKAAKKKATKKKAS